MSELIIPTTLEKLTICSQEVSERAEELQDIEKIHEMARAAFKSIAPETEDWKDEKIVVATDLIRYTTDDDTEHSLEFSKEDPFLVTGLYRGGSLREESTILADYDDATTEYEVFLKFKPELTTSDHELQRNLALAKSAIVPVTSIEMIDQA